MYIVNPDYMDVVKLAIHGTGYPLSGGYDELPTYFVYNVERWSIGKIQTLNPKPCP
jgi:hypothetical protein